MPQMSHPDNTNPAFTLVGYIKAYLFFVWHFQIHSFRVGMPFAARMLEFIFSAALYLHFLASATSVVGAALESGLIPALINLSVAQLMTGDLKCYFQLCLD